MTPRSPRPKAKTARRESAPAPSHHPRDDGPEVSVSEGPAGRETLALMAEGLEPVRAEQSTLDYTDKIPNAPGAKTPSKFPAARPARKTERSAPEITIGQTSIGRDTLALIAEQLVPASEPAAPPPLPPASFVRDQAPTLDDGVYNAPLAIFEMLTFVVQGPEVADLAAEALRRRFVETHLLHRLPARTMAQVERIDVTPWTVRGTVVVRVWCRV